MNLLFNLMWMIRAMCSVGMERFVKFSFVNGPVC